LYDHSVNDVTAFVLAGGKSTRMGSDKAFLPWEQGTLLSHALKLAGTVAPEVRIVGNKEKFAGFGTVIEDAYAERGPLGGIHAALSTTITQWNLILAVDLPLLEPRFLEYLLLQAREAQAMVTVPLAAGGYQPLTAVYRNEFVAIAEQSLRENKNKIDPLFAEVKTRVIQPEELAQAGFSLAMFRNLNTPEDFERANQIRP
jgi:molybdopterin-guanine dinucleotide biosynthesis protein A